VTTGTPARAVGGKRANIGSVRGGRCDLPDGIFHVTTRGVDSCEIFRDDEDRLRFLRLLATSVRTFRSGATPSA
jgi:hypothetical protein